MERIRKRWQPEIYYHITMRGNNRQAIFKSEEDFALFFRVLLKTYSKFSFTILAYCLMNNQYHLLIRSPEVPLSNIIEMINKRYSTWFKQKYGYFGQLYETHYFASMVTDPVSLLNVSSYIHQNPVKTSGVIADKMENYTYSSYRHYVDPATTSFPFLNTEILPLLIKSFPELNIHDYCSYCENYQIEKENPPFVMTWT